MSITYGDIVAARQELERKITERRLTLQQNAAQLLSEYRESLSLPTPYWVDGQKKERPYVEIGLLSDVGKFSKSVLASLQLDYDHHLRFKIATVINDSPLNGGDISVVGISLYYEKGVLHADVGGVGADIRISTPSDPGAYIEVCAAIKQLIMSGLIDYQLDH